MELTCTKCKLTKPAELFSVSTKNRTGRYTYCKACGAAASRASRAKLKALGPVHSPTRVNFIPAKGKARLYLDRNWLTKQYVINQRTIKDIASEAGCAIPTIQKYLGAFSIPTRGNARPLGAQNPNWKGGKKNACPRCGKLKGRSAALCLECTLADRRGRKPVNWRGNDIGYRAAHVRVRHTRGSASTHPCAHCGGRARDWAYDHADPDAKFDDKLGYFSPYSTKPDHYLPLCPKCHRAWDRAQIDKLIREGGSAILEAEDPPCEAIFSFQWLALTARNNRDLWIGADGSMTVRDKATYQVIGFSPDFKGLICKRIDVSTKNLRRAA